jgi:hypothetical protein
VYTVVGGQCAQQHRCAFRVRPIHWQRAGPPVPLYIYIYSMDGAGPGQDQLVRAGCVTLGRLRAVRALALQLTMPRLWLGSDRLAEIA